MIRIAQIGNSKDLAKILDETKSDDKKGKKEDKKEKKDEKKETKEEKKEISKPTGKPDIATQVQKKILNSFCYRF